MKWIFFAAAAAAAAAVAAVAVAGLSASSSLPCCRAPLPCRVTAEVAEEEEEEGAAKGFGGGEAGGGSPRRDCRLLRPLFVRFIEETGTYSMYGKYL